MIADTTGPEIVEAYEIPSDEWVRLTLFDIAQMKNRVAAASRELNATERREFNTTLRHVLGMCSVKTMTELYEASNLDQQIFLGTYNKLMGCNG